jgi:hypothetical protein
VWGLEVVVFGLCFGFEVAFHVVVTIDFEGHFAYELTRISFRFVLAQEQRKFPITSDIPKL